MTSTENVLLQRFVKYGDTAAFSKIVRAHTGLVYGVCLHILSDKDKAADATQETFFQFLQKARDIKSSIPAWLHRVATGKAVDMIRSDFSRRHSEIKYKEQNNKEINSWHDLAPIVDQALDMLDDQSRDMLIKYFYEGRSMVKIASEKGISHPTVSRRIDAALNQLREALHRKGAIVAVTVLSSLLMENTVQAAPVAIAEQLAKISLLGARTSAGSINSVLTNSVFSTARSVMTGLSAISTAKIMIVSACSALILTGAISYWYIGSSSQSLKIPMEPEPLSRMSNTSQSPIEQDTPPQPPQQENPPVLTESTQKDQPAIPDTDEHVEQPQPIEEPQPIEGPQIPQQHQQDKFDLSSPEGTVRSFTKMFIEGDADSVLACFLPDGTDYQDIERILAAGPGDPDYDAKLWLQSFDPDVEMPIVDIEHALAGTKVVWLVTFKHDFEMEGAVFQAGSQIELDATLVERDGKWLIDNF